MTFSRWVQARKAYKRPATAPLRPVPSPNSVQGQAQALGGPHFDLHQASYECDSGRVDTDGKYARDCQNSKCGAIPPQWDKQT